MRREHLIAVAGGALGAVLLVAAWRQSVLGMALGLMFSPLPLAMTALGLGLAYLPLAVLSGAVAVAVLTGSFELTALYVAVDAAPVAILSRIGAAAERQGPLPVTVGGTVLGEAAAMLAFAAVLMMAAGLAGLPAAPEGLEATLRGQLQELVTEVQTASPGSISPEGVVTAMARVLPGAAAWDWAFRALIGAAIGQALLARDSFARWPTPAYRTIAVPGWYIGIFGLAGIAGWWVPNDAGFIAANAAVVLSLPLVLQGLAVVHVAINKFGFGRIGLIVFYGVALVAVGAAVVLIVVLGVMEHFLHLRARLVHGLRNGGE